MKQRASSLLLIAMVCALLSSNVCADEAARVAVSKSEKAQIAETAYVATTKAMVYSGPSEDYYPTQILAQGTALEIYHTTDAGWLGIRPPGGSFSWVPASDAYLLPGGKSIEITAKNSVSWIGSSLGTAKQYRWQVRLNVGEQLIKLGEDTIKDKDGKETLWYKIAPPNGEFRWIQSGTISRQPPANLAKQGTTKDNQVVPASSTSPDRSKKSSKVKPANHTATQEGFIYEGEVIEDGAVIDGEVIEGDVVDEGVVEGDVIYEGEVEDGGYMVEEDEPHYDANWNDWQLFEFTDQGLRLPFLERAAAWRNTQPDPLCQDPFSLELAPKQKHQMRPGLPKPSQQMSHRRTPWRDPRELSQQRMMGYPQASTARGTGATLQALRGNLNPGQSSGPYSGMENGGMGYSSVSPNQPTTNFSEPRLAPQLDLSARSAPGLSDYNQSLLDGGRSPGSVDLPNLPQDPFGASVGKPASNWTGRNWFGLGQQSGANSGVAAPLAGGVGAGMQSTMEAAGGTLLQLQQRLSEMVTQPMQRWNFGEMKERLQFHIRNGANPAERGQARLLLERIDEFERHAMRSGYHLSGNSSAPLQNPATQLGGPSVVTASYTTPMSPGTSGTMHNNFDATGWLVPVYAAGPKHPTHALQSDTGQIVAYVTALPGMNLESFVDQAVGVHGLRGFLPEFQAAHIEAQNITRLR